MLKTLHCHDRMRIHLAAGLAWFGKPKNGEMGIGAVHMVAIVIRKNYTAL